MRTDREGSWSNQAGRTGGLVERGDRAGGQTGGVQPGAQGSTGQHLVGHPSYKQNKMPQRMEQQLPDPVQVSNLFSILGQLGGMELPAH